MYTPPAATPLRGAGGARPAADQRTSHCPGVLASYPAALASCRRWSDCPRPLQRRRQRAAGCLVCVRSAYSAGMLSRGAARTARLCSFSGQGPAWDGEITTMHWNGDILTLETETVVAVVKKHFGAGLNKPFKQGISCAAICKQWNATRKKLPAYRYFPRKLPDDIFITFFLKNCSIDPSGQHKCQMMEKALLHKVTVQSTN